MNQAIRACITRDYRRMLEKREKKIKCQCCGQSFYDHDLITPYWYNGSYKYCSACYTKKLNNRVEKWARRGHYDWR